MNSVAVIAGSISTARRSGTPWPFTAFSVQLLDRARDALDSNAFDVAWRSGQLDPQRLYLERFGAEWAAGGGNGDTMLIGNNLLHRNHNIRLI